MAAPVETGLTVVDLERYEADDGRRYELIDGALYVSPAPTLRHQWVTVRLGHLLMGYVEAQGTSTPTPSRPARATGAATAARSRAGRTRTEVRPPLPHRPHAAAGLSMDQPAITIREGHPGDAAMLWALGAETFIDAYAGDVPAEGLAAFVAASFSPDRQAAELADPRGRFFIAQTGGEPIAYAYVRLVAAPSGPVLELARIYTRMAWIGRGVGAALMRACLEEAARHGAAAVRLTVWEHNARAIAFYRRWGFAEVGRERFHLGEEVQVDLVLERAVGADPPP